MSCRKLNLKKTDFPSLRAALSRALSKRTSVVPVYVFAGIVIFGAFAAVFAFFCCCNRKKQKTKASKKVGTISPFINFGNARSRRGSNMFNSGIASAAHSEVELQEPRAPVRIQIEAELVETRRVNEGLREEIERLRMERLWRSDSVANASVAEQSDSTQPPSFDDVHNVTMIQSTQD